MLKRLDWLSETMATGAHRVLCTCISMRVLTLEFANWSLVHCSSVQFVRCEHAFSPPALREAQARWTYVLLMFFIFKIFLVTFVTPIISASIGPIFTKFAGLVELWPQMNDP